MAALVLLATIILSIIPINVINDSSWRYYEVAVDKETGKASYHGSHNRPKNWSNLSSISKFLVGAIIVSEDWAFYQHSGIDTVQLGKVIMRFLSTGKLKRGASTITQQLAKNLFVGSERSLYRKVKELVASLYLERVWGKKRILEYYLNIIEYGASLYGIQPASIYYFQKDPRDLTIKESAFIAMLLPSPKKYSYSYRQKELSPFANERITAIIKNMKMAGYITEEQMHRSLNSKLFFESWTAPEERD